MPATEVPSAKTVDIEPADVESSNVKSSAKETSITDTSNIATSSNETSAKCTHCSKDNAQPCGACGNAYYCSDNCKNADAPFHQLLCHQFKHFQDRPSKKHVRIIFFPADGSGPVFKWTLQEYASEAPDVKELLGNDKFGIMFGEDEYEVLGVYHRSGPLRGEFCPNGTVAMLPGVKRPECWLGPMFVLVYKQEDFDTWTPPMGNEDQDDDEVSENEEGISRADCDTTTLKHAILAMNTRVFSLGD